MDDVQSFLAPLTVTIAQSRWVVVFTIIANDGTLHTFVASADSGDTEGSGIWFGTKEEYEAQKR